MHGFSLEFGGREMAEIDLVGQWDRGRILSAGLIDIKTHYAETPADIVERVRDLPAVPAARRAGDLDRLRAAAGAARLAMGR